MSRAITELQQLRRRIKNIDDETREMDKEIEAISAKQQVILKERSRLQKKLDAFTADHPIVITDHAVVRYLQRIEGLDIKAIENKILPADGRTREAIKVLGGKGVFPVGTSHRLVLEAGRIVTVNDY